MTMDMRECPPPIKPTSWLACALHMTLYIARVKEHYHVNISMEPISQLHLCPQLHPQTTICV